MADEAVLRKIMRDEISKATATPPATSNYQRAQSLIRNGAL